MVFNERNHKVNKLKVPYSRAANVWMKRAPTFLNMLKGIPEKLAGNY